MLNIFIRTVIIYILLTVIMRLMGKRQLGELDVGELVITILLSEIATFPITNPDTPLVRTVVPIAIVVALEIISSLLILKVPFCKFLLSSKPAVLICRGVIDRKELRRARISVEDLISQVRQNGIYDLSEVDYAILEENGKMSVIPKNAHRQPDKADMGLDCADSGIMHIVISDGQINAYSLKLIGKDRAWLERKLKKMKISVRDVLCMTVDDAGAIFVQLKEGRQITAG